MQDGFKQLSGGILEKLLEKFTSNTLYAIATGFYQLQWFKVQQLLL